MGIFPANGACSVLARYCCAPSGPRRRKKRVVTVDNCGKQAGHRFEAADLLLRFDAYLSRSPGTGDLYCSPLNGISGPLSGRCECGNPHRAPGDAAPARSGQAGLGRGPAAVLLDEAAAEAVLRRAASVLLAPPDGRFYERLPLVRRALLDLPAIAARRALAAFCDHAAAEPESALRAHHARTFGPRRSLHLLDHSGGDARRRRRIRARIADVYAGRGWRIGGAEPPDHLAVVLEFAARADAQRGERLLARLRPGLERLRAALAQRGTPYAGVLEAVRATLPAPERPAARLVLADGRWGGRAGAGIPAVPMQARGPEPSPPAPEPSPHGTAAADSARR
nr:molecular chaperone TorD family protein [Streptomonospora sp. PA3]